MRPSVVARPASRETGSILRRVIVPVSVGATVAVAASVFSSTFRFERIWLPMLVAAFGPVLVDTVEAGQTRRRWWVSQTAAFVVSWLATVLVLDRSGGVAATLGSLVQGWGDILSTTAPAAVTVATVSCPFLLTWWTAAWALELCRRTSWELTPLGPPVLLAVVGSIFAPTGALPYSAWPFMFLGAAGLVAIGRLVWSPARFGRSGFRSTGAAVTGGAVGTAVAAALVGAAVLAGVVVGVSGVGARNDAAVLRRWRQPQSVRVEAIDPFTVVSSSTSSKDADQPVARLQVPQRSSEGPLRLRISTAERFDGTRWSTSGRFLKVGDGAPDGPRADTSAPLEVILNIDRSAGLPFLPTPALVKEVVPESGGDLVVDETDSMWSVADTNSQIGPGIDGRYVIRGSELADGSVPATSPRTSPMDRQRTPFDELARKWAGLGPAEQQARRLEQVLNGSTPSDGFNPKLVEGAPSDPSLARINSLLGSGPPGDSATNSGTSAEFAGAFALLGRGAGLTTRLVLGIQLSQPTAGRTLQLRRGDLRIWPEVLLERDGAAAWVPFNPAPGQLRDVVPELPDPTPSGPSAASDASMSPTTIPVESDAAAGSKRPGQRPIQPIGDEPTPEFLPGVKWLAISCVVALIAIVSGMLVIWRRRLARRTRGRPDERIAAGWAQVARVLARREVPNARLLTPAQTEDAIIRVFGDAGSAAAATMHDLVDRGLFGPENPSPEDAERMWVAVDEIAGMRPLK